jgi:hypothetical protein
LTAGFVALVLAGLTIPAADAQMPNLPDDRFAGLQWTFARIRYSAWTLDDPRYQREYWRRRTTCRDGCGPSPPFR